MTVDDPVQSSQFLLKRPPTFYDAKIPFKHWQLRSLLCSPAPDLLYYPSNHRIYSLDTATRQRRLVATLPFSPRCIGARYGWVCVGGADRGQFATIRVRRAENSPPDPAVDPMALDAEDDSGEGGSGGGRTAVETRELGGYIVNSVTLHRPPSSTSGDDVLAVLTNNDKTVRIFHLAENRTVTTLHVDVSTNHASISPDGQHLVVVGDSPKVYFYHPAASGSNGGSPGIGEAGCGSWVLSSHPPLSVGVETDALMSTSFSSSSLHCAVASQAGIITVFDTRYLSCDDGCDPLVKVITSSRAFTEPGAVRSVQFSPAPWDLLVWAEHCGRVCIADARSNFSRQQVVEVLAGKDELVEVDIEEVQDTPSAWDLSQSLQGNPTNTRRYSRDDEDTEEDIMVSESASIDGFADLVLDTSSEWITARVRSLTPGSFLPADPDLLSATHGQALRSAGPGLLGSTPGALRDHRERQLERDRARQRIQHDPPRRRNSIHPSYTEQAHSSAATGPTSVASSSSERERSRLSRGALMPLLTPLERFSNLLAELRPRRRGGRFEVESVNFPYRYAADGVDITGCTMGPDGRKLYVATDSGVVEYGIDIAGRKVFPSMTPR